VKSASASAIGLDDYGGRDVSRQSRVVLAAIVGLLVGLGTLAGVVLALRDTGGDDSGGDALVSTDVLDTADTGALPPVETSPAELTRTVEIGGSANAVAVGAGAVWVVRDGRRLVRIDPSTAAVVGRIGAGDDLASDRPCTIAVGAGAVWVTTSSGNVARINPETNRLARLIAVDDAACIAVGAGGVWVTSPTRGVVTRIDPATNELVAEITVGGFLQGVATGAGSVWVASSDPPEGDGGSVSRIDRGTNSVSATIPVDNLPEWLVAGPGGVWVSGNDGTIRRIDIRANALEEPGVQVADGGRTTLTLRNGRLWATAIAELGEVAQAVEVDPSSGEIVGSPIPVGQSPLGMAFGAGTLWVTNYELGMVTAYTPPPQSGP
jgi:DNA-binding beta-propeller fold protein YncE